MTGARPTRLDQLRTRAQPAIERTARRGIAAARALLDRVEAGLGFFSGPNSTMSRDGDTVELTPRGRREVQYWAPTFRAPGGGGA